MRILHQWIGGVRFYIALGIAIITGEIWLWTRLTFASSNVVTIRLQESYAWCSLIFLAAALLIGPLYKVYKTLPGLRIAREARRMIGIGAAWFTVLHVIIAYVGQFKGLSPFDLPSTYQSAFLYGAIALLILVAMAVTSFDGAFRGMGVWWFRLHRLVHVAAPLVLLHAFLIGVHAPSTIALISLTVITAVIVGLQVTAAVRGRTPTNWQVITLTYSIFLFIAVLNLGLTQHLGHNLLLGAHGAH